MRSWENQMDALVDMYLDWKAGEGDEEEEMSVDLHEFEVTAIGTFSKSSLMLSFFLSYP